jgi:hypothetical protein
MKKVYLFFLISIALIISSCGKHCVVSKADGAADCSCKLMKEFDQAKGDAGKTKEVSAKYDEFIHEFEKNISEGLYTEEEVNELIGKKDNCN